MNATLVFGVPATNFCINLFSFLFFFNYDTFSQLVRATPGRTAIQVLQRKKSLWFHLRMENAPQRLNNIISSHRKQSQLRNSCSIEVFSSWWVLCCSLLEVWLANITLQQTTRIAMAPTPVTILIYHQITTAIM